MRKFKEANLKLGEVDVGKISIDLKSRDEMTQILAGLQSLHEDPVLYSKIEILLTKNIAVSNKGREGMSLWNVLVLSIVHANLNIDFDKLKDLADNHITLREMLGHSLWLDDAKRIYYPLQTLRDNVKLLSPEILAKTNEFIVKAGHKLLGVLGEDIHAKCDSAVTKINSHFPTDINLLWDGMRKSIELTSQLCDNLRVTTYRQSVYNLKMLHNSFYSCCQKRCKADKNGKFDKKTIDIYEDYIGKCESQIKKIKMTLDELSVNISSEDFGLNFILANTIVCFMNDAEYQIGLIVRRIIGGEKIPNCDKIHSLFQRHTEWISKGKAGVRQELGIRVAILTDRHGFILKHRIMQNETDDKVPVTIIKEAKEVFPNITTCSFDKGFWSPQNRDDLEKELSTVAMKKKGYSSKLNYEHEHSPEFLKAKKGHSAVESDFHAAQNHGFDKSPESGIKGFKRYIAKAVVARNIQILGKILMEIEQKKNFRSNKIKEGLAEKIA